ncbi:MAG: hypothetical protein ABI766_11230 [Gemmatimonadales bacterium]
MNPYDYARGRGMARSSWVGRLLMAIIDVPVLGETVMRLRSYPVIRSVLNGGVADPRHVPLPPMKERYVAGNRPGPRERSPRPRRVAGGSLELRPVPPRSPVAA